MSEHTPTPWKAYSSEWNEECEREFYGCDCEGDCVGGHCPHGCPEDDCIGHVENPPWWLEGPEWVEINGGEGLCFTQADAEYIVRCVNAHEALVQALREILYHGVTHPPAMSDAQYDAWTVDHMRRIAFDALQETRGESC